MVIVANLPCFIIASFNAVFFRKTSYISFFYAAICLLLHASLLKCFSGHLFLMAVFGVPDISQALFRLMTV